MQVPEPYAPAEAPVASSPSTPSPSSPLQVITAMTDKHGLVSQIARLYCSNQAHVPTALWHGI